jgi:hypothetical protein
LECLIIWDGGSSNKSGVSRKAKMAYKLEGREYLFAAIHALGAFRL